MVLINLLPWRETQRKLQRKQFFFMMAGAAIIGLLLMALVHTQLERMITKQQGRNQFFEQRISELELELKEIDELQNKKSAIKERMATIQELQQSRLLIVHLFDEMVRILPEGVYFTNVKREGSRLTIEGKAESNIRVSELLRRFDRSEWFATATLVGIEKDKEQANILNFSLQVFHQLPNDIEANS